METVTAAVRVRSAADERVLADRTLYKQSFQQCQNLWEDTPDVRPLTFHPRVGQAAAALLDVPVVRSSISPTDVRAGARSSTPQSTATASRSEQ